MIDKFEFINTIISHLNSISVSGAQNVLAMGECFKMLSTLKKGLQEEDSAKAKTIDCLKETIRRLETPEQEDGGDVVGGQHYDIDFREEVKRDD